MKLWRQFKRRRFLNIQMIIIFRDKAQLRIDFFFRGTSSNNSRYSASLSAKLIVLDQLIRIATFNFHDAAKFEPGRINGSLLPLTLLSPQLLPVSKASETERVRRVASGRQSALGGVTNCKLIASIYISASATKAHVRIESRRLGFPVFPSRHLPRRVARRHIHVNRRNFSRDLFRQNYWDD